MNFAIAAAGTGGHIFPALAVADELRSRGHTVTFFGGDRLETTAVPAAGYELVQVEIRGLRRSLSPSNLALPLLVRRASVTLSDEIIRRDVAAVLVMGGYITVPAAWAARRAGVPFVVHEQNGEPGLANRLVARWAERVLVAFPRSQVRLRTGTVVGNPLRSALSSLDPQAHRPAARAKYGLDPDGIVLGVLGGSLGAKAINDAVSAYAPARDRPPIIHLAGKEHAATLALAAEGTQIPWRIVAFEDSMEDFYAACDLVVSRAGASTVSELAVTGTPAILVPLEAVSQQHNAAFLVDAGAARLLPQEQLTDLGGAIGDLVEQKAVLEGMRAAALRIAKPEAASVVARALVEAAGG